MKIAITGGAGFVGSHLAEFLLAQGHQVTCLDNLITGYTFDIFYIPGNEVVQTGYLMLLGKQEFGQV